jgi:hypothetical protein
MKAVTTSAKFHDYNVRCMRMLASISGENRSAQNRSAQNRSAQNQVWRKQERRLRMGRRLRSDEINQDLGALLGHCMMLADNSGQWLTAAHIAQALHSLGLESALANGADGHPDIARNAAAASSKQAGVP